MRWLMAGGMAPVIAIVSAVTLGCGSRPPEPQFPASVWGLEEDKLSLALLTSLHTEVGSHRRDRFMAGYVERQLGFSLDDFRRRSDERGARLTTHALGLLRPNERLERPVHADAVRTVHFAADTVARTGDDGTARALYSLVLRTAEGEAHAAAQKHLDSLRSWQRARAFAGPAIFAIRDAKDSAVAESLVDPSPAVRAVAEKRVLEWIEAALALRQTPPPEEEMTRDLFFEIRKAGQLGPLVLASLYLRGGDAASAVRAVDERKLPLPPELGNLLAAMDRVVLRSSDAVAWRDLFLHLRPYAKVRLPTGRDELGLERALFTSALVTVGIEACRRNPRDGALHLWLAEEVSGLGFADMAAALASVAVFEGDSHLGVTAARLVRNQMDGAISEGDFPRAERAYRAFDGARKQLLAVPGAAELTLSLAELGAGLALESGDFALAERRLESLSQGASSEVSLLWGALHVAKGRLDAAHAAFARAASDSNQASVRARAAFGLSEVLALRGDAAGASRQLADVTRNLAHAQGFADDLLVARVWFRLGALERSIVAAERAEANAKSPWEARQAALCRMLSLVLRRDRTALRAQGKVFAEWPEVPREQVALWQAALDSGQVHPNDPRMRGWLEAAFARGPFGAILAQWLRAQVDDKALERAAHSPDERRMALELVALRAALAAGRGPSIELPYGGAVVSDLRAYALSHRAH